MASFANHFEKEEKSPKIKKKLKFESLEFGIMEK